MECHGPRQSAASSLVDGAAEGQAPRKSYRSLPRVEFRGNVSWHEEVSKVVFIDICAARVNSVDLLSIVIINNICLLVLQSTVNLVSTWVSSQASLTAVVVCLSW